MAEKYLQLYDDLTFVQFVDMLSTKELKDVVQNGKLYAMSEDHIRSVQEELDRRNTA